MHPLGACDSYAPAGCGNGWGYGTSDIFYLEVCIFERICRNGADLYNLNVGDNFHCEVSRQGMLQLKQWLLSSV